MADNQARGSATFTSVGEDYRSGMHRGWVDRQHECGWTSDYETQSREWQLGYEVGRLAIVGLLSAGMAVPIWRYGETDGRMIAALGSLKRCGGLPWPIRHDDT